MTQYNVFLSYNSKSDRAVVQELAERITQERLKPFVDTRSLVPGELWEPELKLQLATCETIAILIGPAGLGDYQKKEVEFALELFGERGDCRIIPVLLPGAEPLPDALALWTYVHFQSGLDDAVAFKRLIAGIQGVAPEGDFFRLPDDPAPYRGLQPFTGEHSQFFFGRKLEVQTVREKLSREPFVAVVGASGAGKSSLVLGGVVPRLREDFGPDLHVLTMRPGSRPLWELANQVASLVPGELQAAQVQKLYKDFAARSDGLCTALSKPKGDVRGTAILIVDQLEELFTHVTGKKHLDETEPFLLNLRAAMEDGSGAFRVLATLRGDFVGRVLNTPALDSLYTEKRQVFLRGMGEPALRQIIASPAQMVGAFVEKSLISRLLVDISREPGALPLLEDMLFELWSRRDGAWLTEKAYRVELGGLARALGRRAQACYETLSPKQQAIARRIFLRLTHLGEGTDDTKRRVPRSDLAFSDVSPAQVDEVLHALADPNARLLVLDEDTVEVAHEVLIQEWPSLRGWIDENRRALLVRQRLADAATEWESLGKPRGYLYPEAPLRNAKQALENWLDLLNVKETEFLKASQLEVEQQRNEKAAGIRELDQQRRLAHARGLSTRALSEMSNDPLRALLIFREAVKQGAIELFSNVLEAWARESCRVVLGGQEGWMATSTFSPDGLRALTASANGRARVWDISSGKPLVTLEGHHEPLVAASFSPDGSRILTASHDHTACLWDASSGQLLQRLRGHSEALMAACFSPDGSRVLTASHDHTACLWDGSSGQPLRRIHGHSAVVVSACFSPDGSRILTASKDNTVRSNRSPGGSRLKGWQPGSDPT